MSEETARRALREPARMVVVEAPAGCGKTYEAASLASDLSGSLHDGQEVLILAHTNAAVHEFQDRVAGTRKRIRATTIDSFAYDLVKHYTSGLGLQTPIRIGTEGGIDFCDLAPLLVSLLDRCQILARTIGAHYPYIILDEHQDARHDQHRAILALAERGGSRVKVFGDPMQAIYRDESREAFGWNDVVGSADVSDRLDVPHRWSNHRDLGDWILSVREILTGRDRIDRTQCPPSVQIVTPVGFTDIPHPKSSAVIPELTRELNRILGQCGESLCILVRSNAQAHGLSMGLTGRVRINEGVELDASRRHIEAAIAAHGDPVRLGTIWIDSLKETCTGMTAAVANQVTASLRPDVLDPGKKKNILPLLEHLNYVYEEPSAIGLAKAVESFLKTHHAGFRVHHPDALWAIAKVGRSADGEPVEVLEEILRTRKTARTAPERCISTIHKAKGHEFKDIIIAPCTLKTFPDDEESRRLLYVALSRAKERIWILTSSASPSPLLP